MTATSEFTLAELLIVAACEAWRGNGEVIASGLGVIPRLGASLAKLTHSPTQNGYSDASVAYLRFS